MVEFKIKDVTYKMANSWDEVSLEMYMKIDKLKTIDKVVQMKELFLLRVMEILSGVSENGLNKLKMGELAQLIDNTKFLETIPEYPLIKEVDIDGQKFIFSPNINQIDMGEYISIKHLCDGLNTTEQIPKILSVILRPAEEVDGELRQVEFSDDYINKLSEYESKIMKHKVMDLLGGVSFFLGGKQ